MGAAQSVKNNESFKLIIYNPYDVDEDSVEITLGKISKNEVNNLRKKKQSVIKKLTKFISTKYGDYDHITFHITNLIFHQDKIIATVKIKISKNIETTQADVTQKIKDNLEAAMAGRGYYRYSKNLSIWFGPKHKVIFQKKEMKKIL